MQRPMYRFDRRLGTFQRLTVIEETPVFIRFIASDGKTRKESKSSSKVKWLDTFTELQSYFDKWLEQEKASLERRKRALLNLIETYHIEAERSGR